MSSKEEKVIFKCIGSYIPRKEHDDDGACDLRATSMNIIVKNNDDIQIKYNLGIKSEFPKDYVALVFPRSSIYKTRLRLTNSVGVIDSGYRGYWGAVFDFKYNLFEKIMFKFKYGKNWFKKIVEKSLEEGTIYDPYKLERCCQFCLVKTNNFDIKISKKLSSSERGEGGFGSTGK